jgi:hypothetical protein
MAGKNNILYILATMTYEAGIMIGLGVTSKSSLYM